ncbi:hypothetical protein ILFOPFJJ_00614 [Ensifer psoraleae]|nr:hypothetical protein [Sinorhizobium psoraleae]
MLVRGAVRNAFFGRRHKEKCRPLEPDGMAIQVSIRLFGEARDHGGGSLADCLEGGDEVSRFLGFEIMRD